MPLRHREISSWLVERGYATGEIEKILAQLDQYDEHANRESLFEDLASGAFDLWPIIKEALGDEKDQA